MPRKALIRTISIEFQDKGLQRKPFCFSLNGGNDINEFCFLACKQINITEVEIQRDRLRYDEVNLLFRKMK